MTVDPGWYRVDNPTDETITLTFNQGHRGNVLQHIQDRFPDSEIIEEGALPADGEYLILRLAPYAPKPKGVIL